MQTLDEHGGNQEENVKLLIARQTSHSDLPGQQSLREWFQQKHVYLKVGCGVLVLGIVALFLVTLCYKRPAVVTGLDVSCFHCIGGGTSDARGGFPHYTSPECTKQLAAYFSATGRYWTEVAGVASSAISYFDNYSRSVNVTRDLRLVVVFDIDETSLSNVNSFFTNFREDSGDLPALQPVLSLYRFLFEKNYHVTFITGRKESYRLQTVANLAKEGYGGECPGAPGSETFTTEPCWLRLSLRTMNDTRLASVYKPEKRRELMDLGFTVVGSIGDQFSDLNAEYAAEANFKLPNPMYYLL